VPDFLPFAGLRYRGGPNLTSVVAPPYDVIDEEERARLEGTDPYNAVHLILPRPEPPTDAYDAAAARLAQWQSTSVLGRDPSPAFYRYEMQFTGAGGASRRTVGVIGALRLPEDGEAGVLGHERTLPKARSDRLALLRATRANLEPIWCLTLGTGLVEAGSPAAPGAVAVDDDGTEHRLTPITDAEHLAAVRRLVASAPVVLADGHHRFETSCTYREQHPGDPGAASIMTLVVELDETMLDVRPIHRLIHRAPPDLRARLAATLTVEDRPAAADPEGGDQSGDDSMILVDRDGWARLGLTDRARSLVSETLSAELRGVDAARFDALIRPLLGDAELTYRHDAAAVAAIVAKGAADAAVLLRPVTVEQIRAAAFARIRMPEKTSFFWPKPRSGMVFRTLDQ
jgi:uncharacterized protein (DUF1015 family)